MTEAEQTRPEIGKQSRQGKGMVASTAIQGSEAYREEIRETIDDLRAQLVGRAVDKATIENNLNLMRMKEEVRVVEDVARLERQLWTIAVAIQDPSLRKQRTIVSIVIIYTLLTFGGFLALTFSDTVLLPSFNIPYSVLLMGLVGSLVSLYARMSRLKKRNSVEKDQTVWFIINPPIAVVMAGISFGIAQILLPMFEVQVLDESWPFWLLAWLVGLNNWVYLFEKFSAFGDRSAAERTVGGPAFKRREVVRHEVVHESSEN